MSKPLISVLMPAYNAGQFIGTAINSILNQTEQNFELVIINDGSTDSTAQIINQFNDKRIRYVANNKNEGIVFTLNKGIAEARSEFIARQDADDVSMPTRFEKQLLYMQANSDCALLGTARARMNEHGTLHTYASSPKVIANPTLIDLAARNIFVHGSVMMRANALQKIDGYNSTFQHCEDYELWMRFLVNGYQAAILPERLYALREHRGQISHENKTTQTLMTMLVRDLHTNKITQAQVQKYAKDVNLYYPKISTEDKVLFHQSCANSEKVNGTYKKALQHYQIMRGLVGLNWKITRNLIKLYMKSIGTGGD